MNTNIQQILQKSTIEGNIVKLPEGQLDRKDYEQVKKSLELIGGKWKGGKVGGFVFPTDPSDLLAQVAGGEQRNLKKEYQFFATPAALADKMAHMAELEDTHTVLEPSAGQGAIIEAIRKISNCTIYYYELMDVNNVILDKKQFRNAFHQGDDFMVDDGNEVFDRIIANPPFTKNQDIDHIKHMFSHLKTGGILVTLSSPSWTIGSQKKQIAFRKWLDEVDACYEKIAEGTFKESGTSIRSILIKIIK